MPYAVVSNMPGYLPESEPWEFDDFSDAVECLIEDVQRAAEDIASGDEFMAIDGMIEDARGHVELGPTPLGYYVTIDGRVTHFAVELT
jgi:hypothetical protein